MKIANPTTSPATPNVMAKKRRRPPASSDDGAAGNESAKTAGVSVTPAAPDTTKPSVPTGLTAVPTANTGEALVSWNASTDNVGVAGYHVFRNGVLYATAGALDKDLKFYLMARGIPEKEAESLLIQAFVGAAIEPVADGNMREALIAAAVRWLAVRA